MVNASVPQCLETRQSVGSAMRQTPLLTPRMLEAQGIEDACLHCGLCLPACPTYQTTGLESLSPRGRLFLMKEVLQAQLPLAEIRSSLESCLGCLSCQDACPAGVPYESWLTNFKQALHDPKSSEESGWRQAFKGVLQAGMARFLKVLFASPLWLYVLGACADSALRGLAWCMPWLVKPSSAMAGKKKFLGAWGSAVQAMKYLSHKGFQALRGVTPYRPQRFKVLDALPRDEVSPRYLWRGCVMDAWMGEVHTSTQRVWEALTHKPLHPTKAGQCCGALLFHQGAWWEAWQQIQHTLHTTGRLLEKSPESALLLTNAHGCGHMLSHYPKVLQELAPILEARYHTVITPQEYQWATLIAQASQDWLQALSASVLEEPRLYVPEKRHAQLSDAPEPEHVAHVALDSACHGQFGQHITPSMQQQAFVQVLQALCQRHPSAAIGVKVYPVEKPRSSGCCGSAGSYSLWHPTMAQHLGEQRLAQYEGFSGKLTTTSPWEVGAVLTNNPGCLMHLQSLARREGKPYTVTHTATWLSHYLTLVSRPVTSGSASLLPEK
ncbi:MAG: (Fe-S)-binding protein [Vampirovibrionales bacterium]